MAYMDDDTRVHAWEMSPPKRNPDDMSFDDLQEEELDDEEDADDLTEESDEDSDDLEDLDSDSVLTDSRTVGRLVRAAEWSSLGKDAGRTAGQARP